MQLPNMGSSIPDLSYFKSVSISQPPLLVINVSEASPAGIHRIHLPLATDLDTSPFNVQLYALEGADEYSSASYPEKHFRLDVQRREQAPGASVGRIDDSSMITGVDLVLIAPLDRETRSSFELRLLAIDGGSTNPRTGTLAIKILVGSFRFNQS